MVGAAKITADAKAPNPDKVRGNVTWSLIGGAVIPDVLINVGDSRKVFQTTPTPYRTGFGVDCSGLIEESATAAGWRGANGLSGEGWGATTWAITKGDSVKDMPQPFLRPGDIIAWSSGSGLAHILFVNEQPSLIFLPNTTRRVIDEVNTLEANPERTDESGQQSTSGSYLGRTRVFSRAGNFLRNQPRIAYRRLIQP